MLPWTDVTSVVSQGLVMWRRVN